MTQRKATLLVILFSLLALPFYAFNTQYQHADIWSFDKVNTKEWTLTEGQKISKSSDHYKHNYSSLRWDWKQAGSITLKHEIGFEAFDPNSENTFIPSFVVWVYNEKPVDDFMTFSFETDGTSNCHFDFKLNFKGWRAAWVSFERDMVGTPVSSMNQLKISSPTSVEKGSLFIDHLLTCVTIDSRHHTPDKQVPLVNPETKSNWLIQLSSWDKQPDVEATPLTAEEKKGFELIEERYTAAILQKRNVSSYTVEDLYNKVSKYQIKKTKKGITGVSLWFGRNAELYRPLENDHTIAKHFQKEGVNLRAYFDLMMKVATAYANCDDSALKADLETLFMNMYEHMTDQGVAYGSGLGTIHHYGYNWRSYYRALFLMKDVLTKHGFGQEAIDGVQWYAAIGEVFDTPEIKGMDMDAFNTMVMGRLASVLIMPDSPKKGQYMRCFSRWIDNGLLPAPGLNDAFKVDGSSYHHANNYPAYATGGMSGATDMVYYLSQTPYSVSEEGHETLKKALLTMRFYCYDKQWPVSFSGRHPKGTGALIPRHFATLAKAGSPDGTEKIDSEMAAAYIRLVPAASDKNVKLFVKEGKAAEADPEGHISLPYACSSVHRRDGWNATVRGNSRYLWAAEHYIGANYYGRYMAHGSLQIMTGTNKQSGYVQQGWDWNKFAGTTVIELPVDSLEANILNVDQHSGYEEMLFSDEAFAGGLETEGGNGVFAFKLHEHDKYQGSLRANKSYYFWNDQIICLGSGIENTNANYPTHTVLYQNAVEKNDAAVVVNNTAFAKATYNEEITADATWMLDNKGNGYYIPKGNIKAMLELQHSKEQSKRTDTKGTFASATLLHGTAPQGASYEYVVVPQTSNEEMLKLTKTPNYTVLSQTKAQHIVQLGDKTIAYAFFDKAVNNSTGIITNSNMPCIAQTTQDGASLRLNICNPDLSIYLGEADEIYKDGKRVERSIYSRPWRSHESQTTTLEVTLQGQWESNTDNITATIQDDNTTKLSVQCKDGASYTADLTAVE